MISADQSSGGIPKRVVPAVAFGGASVAFWFCCPFWMLVWVLALPLGVTGLVRGVIEYRAASRGGGSRTQPLIALVLSSLGTVAALAYMVFVFTHPELPVQG
ncbi:hypothetical protein OG782_18840 [Streptomyces sp. NBC_00876]|uniref:hypothetical protein n=1 Tax=Streptomyces sp. NBC_00876 TaxID=2975853 RepID=UPI00386DCDDC|nr:hypothetical protein OG782_18840 [Streptomyces sp. NBC_00876]